MIPAKTLATSALVATALTTLSACAVNQTELPGNSYETGSPDPVPSISAPADTPELTVVDASPGGSQDNDPLWDTLAKAAGDKKPVYVDVVVHTGAEVGDSDRVTLTPDTPDSVSVTVDKKAVSENSPGFYRIRGTFEAEQLGDSAFDVKTTNTDEIPGLIPKNKELKKECSDPEGANRIGAAAEKLANDPDTREDLRKTWISAPELWWAIQQSAVLMRETNGETEGDFFFQACESVQS